MSALEVGKKLVELCNRGEDSKAVDTLYDPNIVSIEGQGTEAMPARMEGIDAIRAKHAWWYDNHVVHSTSATGPFVGHRQDQFAVLFTMDITQKPTGQRLQATEVALFTVANGKIVQEEFLYSMA